MTDSTIFDLDEFKPYRKAWDLRLKELTYRASFYDGSVYRTLKNTAVWTLGPRAGKEIKGLFLPLSRAVDIDAGTIPADWTFPEDDPKAEIWKAAQDALFDASNWDTEGVLFVHYGAQYGVSGLRIADIWDEGDKRVILQPVDPTRFMLVYNAKYFDQVDMSMWVETRESDGTKYEYAEVITPESIRIFRDAALVEEYPNAQEVVPLVEVLHIKDGTELGECTYQKSIPMLNEVNEMATRLREIIVKNADPQWVIDGAEPSDLTRGSSYMWFLPEGSSVNAIAPTIDIPGVMEFINEIKNGVKESLPELQFDEVRKNGQVAEATLEIQLRELVIKIKRTRPNYDRGLVKGMQIAGGTAAKMGLTDIAPLDDPELILDPNRAVFPVTPEQKARRRMTEIELERMEAGTDQREGFPQ